MSEIVKTYLLPRHMRLGQPSLVYVTKERLAGGRGYTYWLGTAYEHYFTHYGKVCPKEINGTTRAYNNASKVQITKELYEAFVKEAKLNRKRYRQETPEERAEREAAFNEMVEEHKHTGKVSPYYKAGGGPLETLQGAKNG